MDARLPRLAAPYAPRRPQETSLFQLVQAHLADFLAHAREAYEAPLPRYVIQEFHKYLACGDFAQGFVHTRCDHCGYDLAVAFSCKVRGVCPSCAGRRMAGTAAHLVDCVLPAVPTRQYVLAMPYELSGLAATRPAVLTALSRIFWETVQRRYRRWLRGTGVLLPVETGAITGVHRAGASLNVHVHYHLLALDGVYVEEDGALRFVAAPPPTEAELAGMVERIYARVLAWLRKQGLARSEEEDEAELDAEPKPLSPMEDLVRLGMGRGELRTTQEGEGEAETVHDEMPRRPAAQRAVTYRRFNLHAGVALADPDDVGRERLCRYLTRPAFSVARLRLHRDGHYTYRVKRAGRGRVKVRVMTPVECLARLASIVPPPRYPLLRFHGVLAPHHRHRARVVPRPPVKRALCTRKKAAPRVEDSRPSGDGSAVFVPAVPTAALLETGAAERVSGHVLAFAHWRRLLDGELYAPTARLDWALLLKRTFATDVRVCPRCGGNVRIRAVVTHPESVAKLLAALQRPTARAPPPAI